MAAGAGGASPDLLEKQGHKVFTPTLTGVGERSHLMSKDINLDTHITDLVNVFKWEDLKDVCLVVHSYGGWPGSGALEQIGDRVSSIVWLDAFKPENGQRGFDFASEFSRKAFLAAVEKGEPGRPSPTAEAFRVISEKDRAWVDSKTTPQPNGVATHQRQLSGVRVARKPYGARRRVRVAGQDLVGVMDDSRRSRAQRCARHSPRFLRERCQAGSSVALTAVEKPLPFA